ncbi:MAG: MFS transporter [Candidatus Dadabacteria bacterium]|nr:MFS transporter [Candidatus Dadabacteria bacterium]NIQ12995.1 MFS transporter [Candidatus Dadabacteria bacterium]
MILSLNKQQFRNFSLITLSNFFLFCNFSSFFLLPLYIKHLGGDEAQIGYIMGTFGITSLGTIPLVSYLLDKYGRKKFILLGSFLMFVSSFLFVLISTLDYQIYILRLIQGVAFAFFFTSAATSVSDIVPKQSRAHGLGIFGAFTIASYAIGPSFGELIINLFGFNQFFIYTSVFSIISFLLVLFAKDGEFVASLRPFFSGFKDIVISNRFTMLLITNLIIAGGLGSMLNFFSAFLKDNELNASSFFVTYSITVILVRVFGGRLPDLIDRRKIVAPAILIMSISLILIIFINTTLVAIMVSFLFSLGYGILYPSMSAMIIDRASDDERGKAMGAYNMSFSLGINFLAFALGVIARDFGLKSMYLITGIFVMLGFLIFVITNFFMSRIKNT